MSALAPVLAAAPAAGQVVTGVLGFLVVAAMGTALFFLLRSMNKHLRKVAGEPRWREQGRQEAAGGTPGEGGPGGGDPGGEDPAGPGPDYSRNGSGQAG